MAEFLTLEDAATRLGVSVEKLKEMRSQGEIFGFRDGSSWKFKESEITRVREELSGDVLGDDPGGSSILISEQNVGSSSSRLGSGLGPTLTGGSDSDLVPMKDDPQAKSDVSLVPDPASGSGVRLVNRQVPQADDDDEVLSVGESPADSGSSLLLGDLDLSGISGVGLGSGSDVRPAAAEQDSDDLDLASESSFSLQPGKGDSKAGDSSVLGPGNDGSGSHDDLIVGDSAGDLHMQDEFDLEGEDSLALSDSSGINLTSGSDSGLSLDEPLDLAGTGISGINFGSDVGSASGSGSSPRNAAAAAGGSSLSGIDFAPAGNFDLEPSGEMDFDDDSGSQVVEIDDQAAGDLNDLGGFDDSEAAGFDDPGVAGFDDDTAGAMVGVPAADTTFGLWEVLPMLGAILLMCIAGILVTDLARNLWAAAEGSTSNYNSTISNAITSAIGYPN